MNTGTESAVIDARPPALVVKLTNLIMRPVLRTPLGRLVKPLALLEFTGRRSGARRRVIVGWHHNGAAAIVLTPAVWRANFEHGHLTTVYWCGRRSTFIGTLDADPARVAAVATALLDSGTSAGSIALRIPAGHTLDSADINRTNRAVINFERARTTPEQHTRYPPA